MKKALTITLLLLIIIVSVFWYQNRITISVVIPVYNAEKYLAKCLDSVFAQSGTYEVIAVNDGSTDGSLQILKQYAVKYPNLKIIDQENQGISAARNAGIHAAQYEYITFIDNDDWWEPNAFSTVRKVLKEDKSDILLSDFYDVYDRQWVMDTRGEEASTKVPEESKYPKRDVEKLALFSPFHAKEGISDLYYAGTWIVHSFFKRKFLIKNNIEFPNKIDVAEDLIFLFRAYAYNPLISVIDEPIYNYYNRVTSASKGLKTLNVLQERINYMQQTSEYKKSPRYIQMRIDDSFVGIIFLCIANLDRHRIPLSKEIAKIYNAYTIMFKYSPEELKSARNYQKIKSYLQKLGLNQPL